MGVFISRINSKAIQLEDPLHEVLQPAIVKWYVEVDMEYEGRTVKGFIMLKNKGSYRQPGLRLFRNNRVIEGTTVRANIPDVLIF